MNSIYHSLKLSNHIKCIGSYSRKIFFNTSVIGTYLREREQILYRNLLSWRLLYVAKEMSTYSWTPCIIILSCVLWSFVCISNSQWNIGTYLLCLKWKHAEKLFFFHFSLLMHHAGIQLFYIIYDYFILIIFFLLSNNNVMKGGNCNLMNEER